MERQIGRMTGHFIICGWGRVGRASVLYLDALGKQVVVVDRDPARLQGLDYPTVLGDVAHDSILEAAGIGRAHALIAALDSDADNVLVTLSSRALLADLVITRHRDPQPGLRQRRRFQSRPGARGDRVLHHWKAVSGNDPRMLIMDQKVTTHAVLGELDDRGVTFLTLRMRSAALMKQIDTLTGTDFKTITLDRPGRHNRPKVHEGTGIRLTGYPGTVRQLIVTGLGRDAPTVLITNDHDLLAKALIEHYARRMTIEQRLAEIIQAFHADALSSTVNLNVDLDIMLCVLAQALTAALRARLPGYATVTPDVLQRRFLETPGQITTSGDAVTVRLDRRAYSPVLRQADLPDNTPVPWWGNRTLRFEFS